MRQTHIPSPQRSGLVPYIYLGLAAAFWGGSFVAGRFLVQQAHPLVVAAVRFIFAAAILLALVRLREGRLPRPSARDWAYFFGLGLTGIALYNILFFYGLIWATATESALIVATGPAVVSLAGIIALKERVTGAKLAGIAISILGVAVVVGGGVASSSTAWIGDLLQFGSVIAWAVYSLLGKAVMDRYSALASTAYGALTGAIILTPLALALAPWGPTLRMGPAGWASLAYLTVFATVLGFVFWNEGLRHVELSRGSVMLNAVPFWGALTGSALLGERLGWKDLLGAALVVGGVLLASGIWPRRSIPLAGQPSTQST